MIGIIGGTGPQGRGLAARLSRAGVDVLLGSRDAAKGEAVAADLVGTGSGTVHGAVNGDLPGRSDMLLVAVPYAGLSATLAPLADAVGTSVVMSAVNHLGFDGVMRQLPVDAGSAAQEIAALLPQARVVTAFNNVAAKHLGDPGHAFDEDVLVCGDDAEAVESAVALVDRVEGLRGVAAGTLAHAATIEAMTAVVIAINKSRGTTAGLRITGL